MKKLLLALFLLCPAWNILSALSTGEEVAVLAYSADQLAAKFAGKNRKEVVSAITTIPSYERTLVAPDGTEYEVVRYGKINQDYRLFLFRFKWPQPLVSVAENASGILAMNEKYHIQIPVAEQDISNRGSKALLTTVEDVANNTQYNVYQNGNEYLLFQNGVLAHAFTNAEQYAAFMATLTASNSAYTARQSQQQTALEQAQLYKQPVYAQPRVYYTAPLLGTAVVGGLVWSNRHHRHSSHHHSAPVYHARHHHTLPPLKPSGPPAGTVLIRDIDGRYMNR